MDPTQTGDYAFATTSIGGRHSIGVSACTRVIPLPPADPGRYTALLLFSHARAERRHCGARFSDDARVLAYLDAPRGVRSARMLCIHSDEAYEAYEAYEASIDDSCVPFMTLAGPDVGVLVHDETRGCCAGSRDSPWSPRWSPPTTWTSMHGCSRTARASCRGWRRLAAAAVVRLPDGRYAMMSGAYGHATTCRTTADADHMDHTSYAMPFVHHIALCGAAYHKLIVQDAAWPGWRQWPLGEEARRTADHMDASMASPLRGGAAAQLVARLAPAEADVVRDALRPHMTRFAARRVSAERIRRAWLRYDGAPHGPRGRFLRDLERGWRPDAPCDADASGVGAGAGAGSDVGAGVGVGVGVVAGNDPMRLFADGAAYETYADDRREALRRVLTRSAPTDRVRLRLDSPLELQTQAQRDAEADDTA